MRWPFVSRRERLRREASDWIARLNGPNGERDRQAFEQWYRASPDHAEAYDRLSAIFHTAGRARRPESSTAAAPLARSRFRPVGYALAAAAACAVLAFVLLSARMISPVPEAGQQIAAFTAGSDGRRVVLLDGSEVLLSPGSALSVAIGQSERRLRLVRGEGRFAVVPDARPFIVSADGTEVVARGTQFVVRLDQGRTTVSLIEGQVDVSYPQSPQHPDRRRVTRLAPGQRLVVPSAKDSSAAAAPAAEARSLPSRPAMLQFDDTPLAEAVQQVNRHAGPQVRLRDATLADLRVTGAFRLGDTPGFAQSIAAAFGLEVDRAADGTLWLRPQAE